MLPGEIRLRFHDIAKGHVQAVQNLRAARHRNQVVGLRIKGGDHAVTAVILRAVAEQQIHVAVFQVIVHFIACGKLLVAVLFDGTVQAVYG